MGRPAVYLLHALCNGRLGMDRKELINGLWNYTGCAFPNTKQIAEYLGKSRDYVRSNITPGLDYIMEGRTKQYFVNDVADSILRQRSI